jgi:hypothetical protein
MILNYMKVFVSTFKLMIAKGYKNQYQINLASIVYHQQ